MKPDRCLRCGGPVAEGSAVCARCNPAGLPAPASSQYHATVFVAVFAAMALAALVLLLRG
jgi:hypothetical protein